MTSTGKCVVPIAITSIGLPWWVLPGYEVCTPPPKKYSTPPNTKAVWYTASMCMPRRDADTCRVWSIDVMGERKLL